MSAIAQCVVTLAAAFPNVKLTEALVAVYLEALNDLSYEQLNLACHRAIRECAWFPTVAQLRQFIEPSTDDAAVRAWTALNRAARIVGAYQSLQVEDACAAVALTRTFGGWPQFCECDDGPSFGQKRTEFLIAYREARRHSARADGAVRRLPGICELTTLDLPEGHHGWMGRLTVDGRVLAVTGGRQCALPAAINRLMPETPEPKEKRDEDR